MSAFLLYHYESSMNPSTVKQVHPTPLDVDFDMQQLAHIPGEGSALQIKTSVDQVKRNKKLHINTFSFSPMGHNIHTFIP
jgi:hypothetical protein